MTAAVVSLSAYRASRPERFRLGDMVRDARSHSLVGTVIGSHIDGRVIVSWGAVSGSYPASGLRRIFQ